MHATSLGHVFDSSQLTAASTLQEMVPELVSLSLNAKQVHWNVTGPAFLPIHELTDKIAQDAGDWADLIAERAMALGFTVDGRPNTVAATNGHLPSGRIRDRDALLALIGLIDLVSVTTRSAMTVLEEADPVGHDLAIQVLHGLERYRWMLRAQNSGRTNFLGDVEWTPALATT